MEEDKFKDLLEDEELSALRLAALASKRQKGQDAINTCKSATALPINSIITASSSSESVSNQIPFVQSDRSSFNSNYSWRKQNLTSRRRGGAFLKNNQRSNLIVINPIVQNEGKHPEEKAPTLLLPQHKWCNSGNEDSMSPKTLRKTGPTRFNRHGSDSESSDDSDYEHTDNDSGSNETVLQDEPRESFTRLSPGCETVADNTEKKRRLSFQNLDSGIQSDTFDKNETTSVYNLLKNSASFTDNKVDNYTPMKNVNDSRQTWDHSVESKYNNYNQYNSKHAYAAKPLEQSENLIKQTIPSVISNGESSIDISNAFMTQPSETSNIWQHKGVKTGNLYYSKNLESSKSQGLSDKTPKDYIDKRQSFQVGNEIQDSKNTAWQHSERFEAAYPRETTYTVVDSRNYNKDETTKSNYLSEDDLRLELKKRVLEMKSQSSTSEMNEVFENKKYCQNNTWNRSRQKHSYEGDKIVSCSTSFRNRHKRSFSGESDNDKNLSNLDQRRDNRSSSRDKTTEDNFSNRDRNRFEYSFASERNRYDRSSSLDRNRNESNRNRGRSRYERSSSRDNGRHERSSSQDRMKHENTNQNINKKDSSLSPSRRKNECSFSQERDKLEYSFGRTNEEKKTDYISSRDKSKHDHSSSSDSRHDHSLSQDKSRHGYYSRRSRNKQSYNRNQEKDRYERSQSEDSRHAHSSSQDRSRCDRSSSNDGRGHRSSQSQDSRHRRSSSRNGSRCSSSQDENKDEHSSRRSGGKHKRSSRNIGKSNHKSILEQNKQDDQKVIQNCNNLQNEKTERISTKERQEGNQRPLQKYGRVNDSYKNCNSRSRSSSSESYSSSYSSSSSHSSRRKIHSVPSVIKTVQIKRDTQTVAENKFVGKNMNSAVSQSDVSDFKLSNIKAGRVDGDFKASDNKRVPVHMRLGSFPRKRVIKMPKDVEAAFVNSSSSSDGENVNTKCKRQNIRIVADVYEKSGIDASQPKHLLEARSAKRLPDIHQEKSKRVKTHR